MFCRSHHYYCEFVVRGMSNLLLCCLGKKNLESSNISEGFGLVNYLGELVEHIRKR